MIEFRNIDNVKYIKVKFNEYEQSFLLESKLTEKGIKLKIAKSLRNEEIYKLPTEILVLSFKEAVEQNLLREEIKVNSYTEIAIYTKWDLKRSIKPTVNIPEIFLILNYFDAFYNNYEINFKSFGVIEFINLKLGLDIEFNDSNVFLEFLKNHFNIKDIVNNTLRF
ncbi:MAG: hypothetical protein ACRCW7_07935, partial [Cetobacterium sp.]